MGIAISVGRISTPGVGGCEPNAMFLCDCWTLTIDDRLWDIEAVWVHELAHAVGYLLMHTSMHDYGQHKELEENTADLVMLALAPPWEHRTAVRFRIRQQKTAQRQAKERILILNRIVTALEATPCPSTPSSSPASPSSPPSK
jgi:hypothetical protein